MIRITVSLRRRLAELQVLLVVLLLSTSCQVISPTGDAQIAPGNEVLHQILARGTLRVGMSGTQPPLNMKTTSGVLTGLDVELAQALADAMRVELTLVETPFKDLLDDLERGAIDLVISSLTITPARNARVAFAGPYLISGASLLTRADLVDELSRIEDLDTPERSWAALEGSTGEALIVEAFPRARFVAVFDQEEVAGRIVAGEIDGLVADLPFVQYVIARNPEHALASMPAPFTTEPLGVALPPGSPLFANLVQNYLNTLDYTGQLMQMKARWLSAGDWLEAMQ